MALPDDEPPAGDDACVVIDLAPEAATAPDPREAAPGAEPEAKPDAEPVAEEDAEAAPVAAVSREAIIWPPIQGTWRSS